ncbi:MAG TPA: hypothetical protein VE989_00015 [Sphingomicrobium sp.]|nr:hypothetical protein [Sphingomicrobium sp.]
MAEDAAAPDAFEVAIALEAKDTEGVAAQVVRAHLVHNQTIKALTNFHSLYEITLESGEAGDLEQANSAQDLLRAMLLFACSGLDAVVKQLIEDSLHDVLQHDLGAQREFQKFVERRLKRTPASEETDRTAGSVFDASLLAQLLVSFDPRSTLVAGLKAHLGADSLQSRDQLLKVAAHFAITRDEIMADPEATKRAFDARNQIVHEMDIDLGAGHQRRERTYPVMAEFCENIIAISSSFIDEVGKKIGPPAEGPAGAGPSD